MKEYKPMKWYKSEFMWLLISLVWQVIFFVLIGQNILGDFWVYPMFIGTAYTLYFILKGILYAWFINPMPWYKKQFIKLKKFLGLK
ncbi:MAG: hypothetical protein ACOC3V_03735 [bacterium]